MPRINYAKLEEKLSSDSITQAFNRWADNKCKYNGYYYCSHKKNTEQYCLSCNCPLISSFYKSDYYKNLFIGMPEYRKMKMQLYREIVEQTYEGISKKINASRKEYKCDFCGIPIPIGSPYIQTIDFIEHQAIKSCMSCNHTIFYLYGD